MSMNIILAIFRINSGAAVLDGGWNKIGQNEDPDTPHRLYYVAMTRAKKTLLLARFDRGHPLLDALPTDSSLLRRPSIALPALSPALTHRYQRPTLKDVDIGFAGRHAPMHGVHRAIAALVAGDALTLFWQQEHKRWLLADSQGNTVGRLARAFTPPSGMRCIEARVIAILVRGKEDAEPEYQAPVRCDRWEVVVPELVFEPAP